MAYYSATTWMNCEKAPFALSTGDLPLIAAYSRGTQSWLTFSHFLTEQDIRHTVSPQFTKKKMKNSIPCDSLPPNLSRSQRTPRLLPTSKFWQQVTKCNIVPISGFILYILLQFTTIEFVTWMNRNTPKNAKMRLKSKKWFYRNQRCFATPNSYFFVLYHRDHSDSAWYPLAVMFEGGGDAFCLGALLVAPPAAACFAFSAK